MIRTDIYRFWLTVALVVIACSCNCAFSQTPRPTLTPTPIPTPSEEDWYAQYGPEGIDKVVHISTMYVASWDDSTGCSFGGAQTQGQAVEWANSLDWLGKTDWYLPAHTQLSLICYNKVDLGSYDAETYWSSDTHAGGGSYFVGFEGYEFCDGDYDQEPDNTYLVRAVRDASAPTPTPAPTPYGRWKNYELLPAGDGFLQEWSKVGANSQWGAVKCEFDNKYILKSEHTGGCSTFELDEIPDELIAIDSTITMWVKAKGAKFYVRTEEKASAYSSEFSSDASFNPPTDVYTWTSFTSSFDRNSDPWTIDKVNACAYGLMGYFTSVPTFCDMLFLSVSGWYAYTPTPAPSSTPTPTPTPSITPTPTMTPTPTPIPTPTPSPIPTIPLIDEGFDEFDQGVRPTGWIFTNCNADSDTYITTYNYGNSSPSLRLDATGDVVLTKEFSRPDNLTFWVKGQHTPITSSLCVEEYYSSAWYQITDIYDLPTTGTVIPALALNPGSIRVKFTYTKVVGNLSFDDVRITEMATPSPIPTLTPTPTPTVSPTSSPLSSATPSITPSSSPTPTPVGSFNLATELTNSTAALTSVAVDGTNIYAGSTDGTWIWTTPGWTLQTHTTTISEVYGIGLNTTYYIPAGIGMEVRKTVDFTPAATWTVNTTQTYVSAWADDKRFMAGLLTGGGVQVWDAATFETEATLTEPVADIKALISYTTNGVDYIAGGGGDSKIYIWNADDNYSLQTGVQLPSPIKGLGVMLPEAWIFAGCQNGHVYHYKTDQHYYVDDGIGVGANPNIYDVDIADWTQEIWTVHASESGVQGRTVSGDTYPVTHFQAETNTTGLELTTDTYYLYAPNVNSKLYIFAKP